MVTTKTVVVGVTVALLTLGTYGAAVGSDDARVDPAAADRVALEEPTGAAERPSDADLARSDAVTDVVEMISRLDESDESGFGTIRTDHDKGAVTVFWSEEPPRALLDLAEKKPRGIEITVEHASYSRAELQRGADAIAKQGLYDRLDLMFVNPEVGSGITIGTSRKGPFTDAELGLLREVSKIEAIKVEYEVPPVVGYSRIDDSAPWKGGIRLRLRTPEQ